MFLQTHNLVCGHSPSTPLFSPLNLTLFPGTITALLGGNGQGKTTLMRTLTGQHPLLSGRILRHGQINFVPQRFSTAFSYSVLEMVLMGRAAKIGLFSTPSLRDRQRAREALTQLGIAELAERPFNRLSGGQQQLVLIARALATECQVLILDEPTTALDLAFQARVVQLLHRLARQQRISILFSTHDPAQAERIADNVLMLMKDKRCLYGPKEQILTDVHLSELYGITMSRCDVQTPQYHFKTLIPCYGLDDEH